MKPLTAKDWPRIALPGSRVFIGSGAACPQALVAHMLAAQNTLADIELAHIRTYGPTPWIDEKRRDTFKANAFFMGPGIREAVNAGVADYTPCFLSELPSLFLEGVVPLRAALVMVSPPDNQGYCSLGVSVDVVHAACRAAQVVVAQINPRLPRTFGETFLHVSEIDYCLEAEAELPEWSPDEEDAAVADKIGEYLAQLVEDGSTLQVGIGDIADRAIRALKDHRHLGIHTEMFSDGVRELIEAGAVDNSRKQLNRGHTVASFCVGSRALYDFVHENAHISFRPTEYTNNIAQIAKNRKVVAINSAMEVDMTGQVAASVQGKFYSGIGGLMDFTRGAVLSSDGLPIIALPSTAQNGERSRIVPFLSQGAGLVGSRADVHFVVTEHGIATLRGRNVRERALELIQVADPKFREELLRSARERKLIAAYEKVVPRPVKEIGGVEFQRIRIQDKDYVLRPLHPSDERNLQEFFYSHTAETIQKRYGYSVQRMSRERASELVGVNQEQDLALGVFERRGPRQRLRAVGRYYLEEDESSAEVAFVVDETMRRHGLGSLLLKRMMSIAHRRGLQCLWALVAPDNIPMLRLFEKYHGKRVGGISDGMVHIRIPVSECE
ncbi:GNAT family N-acetyltransferase [Cerasicoccus fimbriatus]|uniref:GNAT family N-acetyltransferase n=1 Tax=Cerasicoccus fimbriatus TaxID=3014554 RepID=UPI003CCCF1D6